MSPAAPGWWGWCWSSSPRSSRGFHWCRAGRATPDWSTTPWSTVTGGSLSGRATRASGIRRSSIRRRTSPPTPTPCWERRPSTGSGGRWAASRTPRCSSGCLRSGRSTISPRGSSCGGAWPWALWPLPPERTSSPSAAPGWPTWCTPSSCRSSTSWWRSTRSAGWSPVKRWVREARAPHGRKGGPFPSGSSCCSGRLHFRPGPLSTPPSSSLSFSRERRSDRSSSAGTGHGSVRSSGGRWCRSPWPRALPDSPWRRSPGTTSRRRSGSRTTGGKRTSSTRSPASARGPTWAARAGCTAGWRACRPSPASWAVPPTPTGSGSSPESWPSPASSRSGSALRCGCSWGSRPCWCSGPPSTPADGRRGERSTRPFRGATRSARWAASGCSCSFPPRSVWPSSCSSGRGRGRT